MWELKLTSASGSCVAIGSFESVAAAARRIFEPEGYPAAGVLLIETQGDSGEKTFGRRMEHACRKGQSTGRERSRAVHLAGPISLSRGHQTKSALLTRRGLFGFRPGGLLYLTGHAAAVLPRLTWRAEAFAPHCFPAAISRSGSVPPARRSPCASDPKRRSCTRSAIGLAGPGSAAETKRCGTSLWDCRFPRCSHAPGRREIYRPVSCRWAGRRRSMRRVGEKWIVALVYSISRLGWTGAAQYKRSV